MELHELSTGLLNFILGGRAVFTILNERTGNRFTFRVMAPKGGENDVKIRFVKVLTGPDNTTMYEYIGFIPNAETFVHGKKSRIGSEAPSVKAFSWLFSTLKAGKGLPEGVKFFHSGHCCRCGRKLTTPESVTRGLGAECWEKAGLA